MAEQVKVEAELSFDSNAAKLFGDLKHDIAAVNQQVTDSRSNFREFFTQFAAMTSANLMGPALQGMRDFVGGSIEASAHADNVQQSIAGMMDAMSPREWDMARGGAQLLYEDIAELSIKIGSNKDEILGAHAAIRTFLGGNDAAFQTASANIENLTLLADRTGMSVQGMGEQFGKIAAGFVSTEAPLYNLLKTTGIFNADITKVVPEWQKLTQAERVQRLEGAFGKIAGNLHDAAPTMGNLLASIKESGEMFLESFGGAVLRELLDNVDGLQDAIAAGGDEFDDFAKSLGEDVGKNLAGIVDSLTDAIDYMSEHGAEIKQEIVDGFQFAKDVFTWILDHKEELAIAFGASQLLKMPGVAGGIGNFVGGIRGAATAAVPLAEGAAAIGGGGLMSQAGGIVGKAVPAFFGAIVAGGPPVWAAAAAVAALTAGMGYLAHEAAEADEERRKEIEDLIVRERERSETLSALSTREFELQVEERERLIELAEQLGERTEALNRLAEAGADRRAMREQYVVPAEVAAGNLALMQQQGAAPDLMRTQEELAVTEMTNALKNAVKTGDAEVTKALMGILLDNEKLKEAFMNSADTVSIGAEGLKLSLKALEDMGLEGGYLSKFFGSELDREFTGKAAQTAVNFNGGQVFKIQQDFRDQDPDRIAVAFREEITRSAVSRVQASTSSPFGA